jgi:hypothetical protein
VNTRAYRPSSGPGADGGRPVKDAGAGLGTAVKLIVMTAKAQSAAY